ncbi:SPX domain-containing protein 1-like isoform X1 [Phragmites australis]|uniref:SPX domain-containing protein 1-like isoform X1 n=1 Tax=Phragmites australis TaxID=29695 RepID=UPI002D7671BA|nr:SPX domain-containing protein 1-like isoform X1 [Phragmites australis]
MKFGKSLSGQIVETLPEWRDKFLSYKDLKKLLKLIGAGGRAERQPKRPRREDAGEDASAAAMTPEEADFMRLLEAELDKFNSFFVEKEEEYIIRQKELQDRVARAAGRESKEELMRVRKEIVDFHGEMVLLENYSALNYTGLVKILKKYDKRTGALIRLPFIQKVLQQPFFTTELLFKLVKQSEAMLEQLLPTNEPSVSSEDGKGDSNYEEKPAKPSSSLVNSGGVPELDEIEYMESMYMKSTVAALRSLKEIRSKSSTVSMFSLPPLQGNNAPEDQERWNKIPIIEQAAK